MTPTTMTTPAPSPALRPRMAPAVPPSNVFLRRFTVDEYHRMIDAGILTEDDPVELLEGWVRYKTARNPLHDSRIEIARRVLTALLTKNWGVRGQSAITLNDSEPVPDLAIVLEPPTRYDSHHPRPAEIGFLVEVANTSLESDRNDKGPVYASEGIPFYWIVNLVERQIEVYSDPTGPGPAPAYRQRQDYRAGDAVPLVLGGQMIGTLNVQDLLP